MNNYEKPVVLKLDEVAEGVYAASGAAASDQQGEIVCQSVYIQGVWHRPNTYTPGRDQEEVITRRGCEGCSADDGDGCKIKKGKIDDLNKDGVFKPTWEQEGMGPNTIVW